MMTTPISENAVGPNDKIVRRLDDFPELMQALRGGDLLTGRLVCAQLFDFHRSAKFGDASATGASLKMNVKTHIKAGAGTMQSDVNPQ
jgi:hypothetical protein